jgi:hypothetical protein
MYADCDRCDTQANVFKLGGGYFCLKCLQIAVHGVCWNPQCSGKGVKTADSRYCSDCIKNTLVRSCFCITSQYACVAMQAVWLPNPLVCWRTRAHDLRRVRRRAALCRRPTGSTNRRRRALRDAVVSSQQPQVTELRARHSASGPRRATEPELLANIAVLRAAARTR